MKAASQSDEKTGLGLLLLRLLVGWVFLSEGIQKFLFPEALGAGRFLRIGIPAPAFTGPFVGFVETVCGLLLIAGFCTTLAAIPLLIDIGVAITATKIPFLMKHGFWAAMHEARTDFCMFIGLLAILLLGAGALSVDEHIFAAHATTAADREEFAAESSATPARAERMSK